ncbi:MAG: DUF86 domain-containing protein [Chloroflexi bacterium]|nr:DUF86 domain-containing protein [Chloroflexota bacterium]
MPPLLKTLILKRMKDLDQYLTELEPYVSIGIETYLKDREKRYIVERLIQLIVEVASDINRGILETRDVSPSETYYSSFEQLGKLKIIPRELSIRLASTTGLRNRLVHRYEDVEHMVVYHSAVRLLTAYRRYIKLLHKYLESAN